MKGYFLIFQLIDVKMIPDLVSPFVDDRHVDIINKNRHFLPSRGSISGPHPLIHIAFHSPLKEKQGSKLKKDNTYGDRNKTDLKFHSEIIHSNSLINA